MTGESSWEKPSNWQPLSEEIRVKNVDDRGSTYFYHILTGDLRWPPPCTVFFGDAQKFCVDCLLTFCEDHFEEAHDKESMRGHE